MTIEVEHGDASDPVESVPVEWLTDAEMTPEVQRLDRLMSRAQARKANVVAAAHRRGVPQAEGFGSTTAWLIAVTGEPPAVCRSRVRVALALQHMPQTTQAFACGDVSEPRVRLLVEAREAAPAVFARDERLLVSQACSLSARVFPKAVAHWRRLADPDGARADAAKAFQGRRLCVSATWGGMVRLDGDLDPESGSVVMTAIGSLAEPWALDRGDSRSPAQRRADALVEICRRHLDSSDRPRQGGERPHLLLTLSPAELAGDGLVDLDTGSITAETARRLTCDCNLTPIALDSQGDPVAVGRRTRVVPPALRRALEARDGGCTHPGCDVPARWCDAHHIQHWARGGKTEMANLKLLCRRHHGWEHDQAPCPKRE
ncbi:MAG: DUF222 domain-containing protein [Acidimicrobiia bacterium]|nr:DUF222 domain-containing protein [Acidimicrobiia bacterium]